MKHTRSPYAQETAATLKVNRKNTGINCVMEPTHPMSDPTAVVRADAD